MKQRLYDILKLSENSDFRIQYLSDKSNQWNTPEKLTNDKILQLNKQNDIRFIEVITDKYKFRIAP